jgi:hypothetical protein
MVLEGFEKFTETGRSFTPKVSIRANGQIGFNRGAVKRFNIAKYDYVTVYFNKKTDQIAIQFHNDEDQEGAIKIVKRENNYFFSGKSFLEYQGIRYAPTKTYIAEWDDENNIAILKVNEQGD